MDLSEATHERQCDADPVRYESRRTIWDRVIALPVILIAVLAATLLAPSGRSLAVTSVRAASTTTVPPISKVLVIVLENHSLAEMKAGMPYTFALAQRFGYATDYHAVTHPSLPNYLSITSGSHFGITDDSSPAVHVIHGESLFGQVSSIKTYAEGMTSNCQRTDSGNYAVKHNPQAYFVDERTKCEKTNVSMGTPASGNLRNDIEHGSLPRISFAIPNLCNDAHNCPLATADAWIKSWLTQIQAGSDYRSGRLAVVITADEDDHTGGNAVLTTVIAPVLAHRVVTSALTHYSLLRFLERVAGVGYLRAASTAPAFGLAFGI